MLAKAVQINLYYSRDTGVSYGVCDDYTKFDTPIWRNSMGRSTEELTQAKIKALKWEGKDFKKADGKGLFILVKESGKFWRMKYIFNKKEKLLSFGPYPEVTLAEAREKRDEAKKLIRNGIDPSEHKKIAVKAKIEAYKNTFELVAREWWNEEHVKKVVPNHANKNLRRLEQNIFPYIGNKPIAEVGSNDILNCLKRVADIGHIETAHRIKGICSSVFCYAIATERTKFDVTAALKGRLPFPKVKHHAAIVKPEEFSGLMKMIHIYKGTKVTTAALKFSPLVFVRPWELRHALWEQIDFEARTWEFIPCKLKDSAPKELHIVPLSNQAIDILKDLYPITSKSIYIFPSIRTTHRPMSSNTINAALESLGIPNEQMTAHGFRASARTMLEEVLNYEPKYIEKQLAHTVRDHNGTAYNRTAFIDIRRKMMQHWADYLDELRNK